MGSKNKRLTRQHIDKFLKGALAGLLQKTRETNAASVVELSRLVDLERALAPSEVIPRDVSWVNSLH